MARAAQQTIVLEAAFATAVGNRKDVIRLPTRLGGSPGPALRARPRRRLASLPASARRADVDATGDTATVVTSPDLFANVPRVAAEAPLVHAGIATERSARRRDRSAAPPADGAPDLVAIRNAPSVEGNGTTTLAAHHPGESGGWGEFLRPGAYAGRARTRVSWTRAVPRASARADRPCSPCGPRRLPRLHGGRGAGVQDRPRPRPVAGFRRWPPA